MKRQIITIDESKCTGCGLCLPGCPEGALRVIDGKARLISDLFCDGMGACLGICPEGAITITEREASPYDERKVIAGMIAKGDMVVEAHLRHLHENQQGAYLRQALEFLHEHGIAVDPRIGGSKALPVWHSPGSCPGTQTQSFGTSRENGEPRKAGGHPSRLTHWPIQLHLISPRAPHFRGSDLLLAADCVAYATAGFHEEHLNGRTLVIACPKLDSGQEVYLEKLVTLITEAEVRSVTVMVMQVPCCAGLMHLARSAAQQAGRELPLRFLIVGLRGEILQEGSL